MTARDMDTKELRARAEPVAWNISAKGWGEELRFSEAGAEELADRLRSIAGVKEPTISRLYSEDTVRSLTPERNLYMGKYRALLKLINRTRNKLVQVTDHIEDEGDRVYFGSGNHADDLKELYHEMMDWIWDATDETNRMKSDPYADIRKQRERAKKAEAQVRSLVDELEAMRKALEWTNNAEVMIEDSPDDALVMVTFRTFKAMRAAYRSTLPSPSAKQVDHE